MNDSKVETTAIPVTRLDIGAQRRSERGSHSSGNQTDVEGPTAAGAVGDGEIRSYDPTLERAHGEQPNPERWP